MNGLSSLQCAFIVKSQVTAPWWVYLGIIVWSIDLLLHFCVSAVLFLLLWLYKKTWNQVWGVITLALFFPQGCFTTQRLLRFHIFFLRFFLFLLLVPFLFLKLNHFCLSLKISQMDCGQRSFCCVLEIGLQVFSWKTLHLRPLLDMQNFVSFPLFLSGLGVLLMLILQK